MISNIYITLNNIYIYLYLYYIIYNTYKSPEAAFSRLISPSCSQTCPCPITISVALPGLPPAAPCLPLPGEPRPGRSSAGAPRQDPSLVLQSPFSQRSPRCHPLSPQPGHWLMVSFSVHQVVAVSRGRHLLAAPSPLPCRTRGLRLPAGPSQVLPAAEPGGSPSPAVGTVGSVGTVAISRDAHPCPLPPEQAGEAATGGGLRRAPWALGDWQATE